MGSQIGVQPADKRINPLSKYLLKGFFLVLYFSVTSSGTKN